MGFLSGVSCGKCGYSKNLTLGVGMLGFKVESKLKENALKGRYGDDWAEFVAAHPTGSFNIEREVYECPCGKWLVDCNMDYTVESRVDSPEERLLFGTDGTLYYKKYIHRCPDCGKEMHRVNPAKVGLMCPRCKTAMGKSIRCGMWD